jgi:DNA-binding NtrC family response regulator
MEPKLVLVVDDDRVLLSLMGNWLTAAGYSVVTCDSFEAGKQQLAEAAPAILLTDVRLGAFNGLQLVILAKERGPDIAAFVMSGFDDATLRREALARGAGYLSKPFSRDQVLAAVNMGTPATKPA